MTRWHDRRNVLAGIYVGMWIGTGIVVLLYEHGAAVSAQLFAGPLVAVNPPSPPGGRGRRSTSRNYHG